MLSLEIALVASIVATALGTFVALALVRYNFRGRAGTNLLVFLPLSTPEIVLGASLLTLFLNLNNAIPIGFWTVLIAHVMFCISFAVVTVKARLIGFDRHLEEAAMDLGANEWMTFQKVTLPLIAPAILAALLLCFAISIDDFVVTYFNAGNRVTFPIFVWGAARVATPPQINVIGTAIFAIAMTLMLANIFVQHAASERNRMTTSPAFRPPSCRRQPATTSGCTSRAWAATPRARCRSSCAARAATWRTRTASATSTRSQASSRSRSATRTARRSGRRPRPDARAAVLHQLVVRAPARDRARRRGG